LFFRGTKQKSAIALHIDTVFCAFSQQPCGRGKDGNTSRRRQRSQYSVACAVKCHGSTLFRQKLSKHEKDNEHPRRRGWDGANGASPHPPLTGHLPLKGKACGQMAPVPTYASPAKGVPRERGVGEYRPPTKELCRERPLRRSAKENNAIPTAFTITNTCA